jgi:NAD(P)-dependent dehydrogenase (short-subunit alcohol dehydrogenase family)
MERRLEGRVAVVTGSSCGIGRAIALNLAEEGATVVIVARTATAVPGGLGSLQRVATEIGQAGGTALPLVADLGRPGEVAHMVAEVAARAGRVDLLVNNAAFMADGAYRSFAAMELAEWRAQLELNLTVPFALMKAFAPSMVAAGGGRIINLVSGSAHLREAGATPLPGAGGVSAAYGATKAGLARLSNALANELFVAGVAVIAVDPGSTTTENRPSVARAFGFNAEGRHGTEVPARTVRYLATCEDPMAYTGRIVAAAEFAVEKGLV